jgi:uncharacterized protein YqgC (DUF456 family)
MAIVIALLFVFFLLVCWLLTLLGLPGNWLMAALTAVYAWLVPAKSSLAIGWKSVAALFLLAALGEIIELVAGALGVAKAGGSKTGAATAVVGSIVGAFIGVIVGVPIPLIGSIVAAVVCAGLGAMAGAVLGEVLTGRDLGTSWRIAKLAFWGRLAGTLGKVLVGAVMIAIVIIAMLT